MEPRQFLSRELIAYLREMFPPRFELSMSHREIDHRIGQQSVINHLESTLQELEENILS